MSAAMSHDAVLAPIHGRRASVAVRTFAAATAPILGVQASEDCNREEPR